MILIYGFVKQTLNFIHRFVAKRNYLHKKLRIMLLLCCVYNKMFYLCTQIKQ